VFLSPTQAADIARRGRRLLQDGSLTHHQFCLLETLLWRSRRHGQDAACASYSALQRLTHMARDTVWTGLARLEQLGLIRKVRRRVRVGWATRTATSIYVFAGGISRHYGAKFPLLASESGDRTPLREIPKKEAPEKEALAAQRALAGGSVGPDLLAARRAQLEARWRQAASA
jgi:hypothetical protein